MCHVSCVCVADTILLMCAHSSHAPPHPPPFCICDHRPATFLVTVMHSNNEVGAIQPIKNIVDAVKEAAPRVLVHSDGAQSVGKVRD